MLGAVSSRTKMRHGVQYRASVPASLPLPPSFTYARPRPRLRRLHFCGTTTGQHNCTTVQRDDDYRSISAHGAPVRIPRDDDSVKRDGVGSRVSPSPSGSLT